MSQGRARTEVQASCSSLGTPLHVLPPWPTGKSLTEAEDSLAALLQGKLQRAALREQPRVSAKTWLNLFLGPRGFHQQIMGLFLSGRAWLSRHLS